MAAERGNRGLRLLDRCLGIPLVLGLGLLRRRRKRPAELRRAGVLCLGCIGDLVLCSGPLADLAHDHPRCRVTLFCSRANQDVARLLPQVHEVAVLPVQDPFAAALAIRESGDFDAWLDSGQWPRIGALLSLSARAAFRVGFATPGQHRHHVYDAVVAHSRRRHELDNFRALMGLLGVRPVSPPLLALPPELEGELAAALPAGLAAELADGRPCAVLHLFPGGFRSAMKEWPLERWAEVGRGLLARGLVLALSGGPADSAGNEALLRTLASPLAFNLAGVRVAPTALLLRRAAVVVSVNTGIMHLAAAVDAPLVSLTGPVSVQRWGAVTAPGRGVALASQRACAPCLHLGFEYGCRENLCMGDIGAADVLAAADRLLAAGAQGRG